MDIEGAPASIRDPGALSRRQLAAVSVGAGLLAAGGALAADIVETDVDVKTADGVCDAALFHPPGKGAWPAVVIFTDILGLRPVFRDMGRRLAGEGYTVLVPNPFYRTRKAPVLEGPFDFSNPADRAKLTPLTAPLTREAMVHDCIAYLAFLNAQTAVERSKKTGVVGFCMGGPYTLVAAALAPHRVGAGASFHGANLVTDKPDSPHLLVPKLKAAYYFGIAANDDARQPDAKDKLRGAFDGARVPAEIEVYAGANHGWCVKDNPTYNPAAAERAWGRLISLYGRALA
ncbi:MAG: dienelactone hydrolase family protein [Caulobacteraceae bacterium]|nr:dienelactone hydrolase family protein [Caulobacteraceae bacterium]